MEIEFDPGKNAVNQKKHGISLLCAESFEWETASIQNDDHVSYGEQRFKATGFIGDQTYVLVFCQRNEKIRVISLRKALPREVRRYANH
ncbi:MAG: BrnT family toxin [Betaproteobacteria bacterium]|nr:BrnT family toxin [Betaproteobacteria bacterium]